MSCAISDDVSDNISDNVPDNVTDSIFDGASEDTAFWQLSGGRIPVTALVTGIGP